MNQSLISPKEITFDPDNGQHVASFRYYDGIKYAEENNLKQTTSFNDVFAGTHFIVCCGDVMISVKETDFSNITRRVMN